eukprot:CAMPEP_0204918512 /NCGR_PEP_ID=MMETSP1397-20131031/16206_1 /ASSEMBLY_ACC=CAM_ASM_000891 /TAXON_ID=49980 /ORGANISM="Climacostomum Climacostomum virens, Strain Stock W-24" /LENGTH=172 /DNA_ID=CAMNT_0052091831 /DNA_START=29 /DNA_END=544 /DNA_ORIENTATION=+
MIVNPTFKRAQTNKPLRLHKSRTPEIKTQNIKLAKQDTLMDRRSKSRLDTLDTERLTSSILNSSSGRKSLATERRGERPMTADLSADKLLEATLQAQTLQAQLARQTPVPRRSPKNKAKRQLLFTMKVKTPTPKITSCKSLAAARYEAKAKRVNSQESLQCFEGLESSHLSF